MYGRARWTVVARNSGFLQADRSPETAGVKRTDDSREVNDTETARMEDKSGKELQLPITGRRKNDDTIPKNKQNRKEK